MLFPWQAKDFAELQALGERWPHALLLHGRAGIGKAEFALHLAQSLLCEAAAEVERPCGTCVACRWFSRGNHPDFRLVLPEALAAEAPFATLLAGDDGEEATGAARDGGAEAGTAKAATRQPSREIRIEQVRALNEFCNVGAHRDGARVVLLYPAEALNAAAANSLLKMLEEPPAGVIFLLVSARLDRLLPTIISRCRQWPMRVPALAEAQRWLEAQGLADAGAALAEAGGAPLAALSAATGIYRDSRRLTLDQLAAGAQCDAFVCGEALQKVPVPVVLGWLQRWVYDLVARRLGGAASHYYPEQASAIARCAQGLEPVALLRFARAVAAQRASETHPLNARLVFESLFIDYRGLFQ
ncbi:MAG: DNA polymerase III subunit delta' [Janthinobacterium lividum]